MSGAPSTDPYRLGPLLVRTLAGDPVALNDLLASLRPYLHLLVRQQRGPDPRPRGDDSDLVQETLMRIHRGLDPDGRGGPASFQGQNVPQLLGWVSQIVRHLVADRERHARAGKRDEAREAPGAPVSGVPAADSTPEQRLLRAERAVRLAAALERLAPHQRDVLQWRFFEQLSFAEISARTGKSVGALRVVCSRALDRLGQDEELRQAMEASA
jgi:RNA polymerase sigma-70 factor (ECF subfamily)